MARLVNSMYSSHFLPSPPASDLDRNISQTIFFFYSFIKSAVVNLHLWEQQSHPVGKFAAGSTQFSARISNRSM